LPFPLAAALAHGQLGVAELTGAALKDPVVLRLCDLVELLEDDRYNQRFPANRLARIEIETKDSRLFDSGDIEPVWEATDPPSDTDLREKFRQLARQQLTDEKASELEQLAWDCEELPDIGKLLSLMMLPAAED
jgi:2-methylcitrate dehydratase PrpD